MANSLERWKAKKQSATGTSLMPGNRQQQLPQQAIYSNMSEDDLPLPPPPPPPPTASGSYIPPKNQAFPDPPAELLNNNLMMMPDPTKSNKWSDGLDAAAPPASAINHNLYANLRPQSIASAGGPIYETISARPSSRSSTYSAASGISSLYSASNYYPALNRTKQQADGLKSGKEAEVDHLTDLLVQSMKIENSNDPEFFGICFACGHKIRGEGSGCSAMGQMYHIKCFTCKTCHKELQGLPFYNVDGKALCEKDYMDTLEKCCVCHGPILDRILRATGKPYHPDCFCCIVCGKCLYGIPFTVDNRNMIHCIEDFHNKFAPRCCICEKSILPEPGQHETVRVVALDKSYHVNCYRCEDCGVQLTSEEGGHPCYPLDAHLLCRNCNALRVNALTA